MTPPPCEEKACASKSDAMKKMFASAGKSPAPSTVADAAAVECPPDRDELGRHSWTLVRKPCHRRCMPCLCSDTDARRGPSLRSCTRWRHTFLTHRLPSSRAPRLASSALSGCCTRAATARRTSARAWRRTRLGARRPHAPIPAQISCTHARSHLHRAASRADLSVWLCKAHNRVNSELGRPQFSCKLADLDERWRTGGPKCDETSLKADAEV